MAILANVTVQVRHRCLCDRSVAACKAMVRALALMLCIVRARARVCRRIAVAGVQPGIQVRARRRRVLRRYGVPHVLFRVA